MSNSSRLSYFSDTQRAERDRQRLENQQKREQLKKQKQFVQQQHDDEQKQKQAEMERNKQIARQHDNKHILQQQHTVQQSQLAQQKQQINNDKAMNVLDMHNKVPQPPQQEIMSAVADITNTDTVTHRVHNEHNAHYSTSKYLTELNLYGSNSVNCVPAVYHTDSSIDTLRVRILLKQHNYNDSVAHKHSTPLSQLYHKQLKKLQLSDSNNDAIKAVEINWQEKVFGPRELLQYTHHTLIDSLKSLFHNDAHESRLKRYYNNQVSQLLSGNNNDYKHATTTELHTKAKQRIVSYNSMTIYTIIQNDNYIDPRYTRQHITSSNAKHSVAHSVHDRYTYMYVIASTQLPTDIQCTEFDTYKQCQSIGTEYILCGIKYYSNSKTVEVTPGFSTVMRDSDGQIIDCAVHNTESAHWYSFELSDGTIFDYRVELCSDIAGTQYDKQMEHETVQYELQKRLQLEYALISPEQHIVNSIAEFNDDMPDNGTVRYNVYGSIDCASEFVGSNQLYITYELHLPKHWSTSTLQPNQVLSAVTQVSTAMLIHDKKTKTQQRVSGFDFPVSWCIESIAYLPLQQPTLYLQVNNIDYWNTHSVVGYGYMRLPRIQGRHTITIPTFKCVPSNLTQLLEQWFIGINPVLNDIKSSVLSDCDVPNNVYNRYGMQTENSGTVQVTLDIVHTYHYKSTQMTTADEAKHKVNLMVETLKATRAMKSKTQKL